MRVRIFAAAALVAVTGVASAPAPAAGDEVPSPQALVVAHQTLPAGDGWAAAGAGTTGGAAADDAHVFVATNRAQLIAALGGDNASNGRNATPKIIFLLGEIDANVDDANNPLSCADYADPAYDFGAFLATYDPAVWGRAARPSGPLEDARVRSTRNQAARVRVNVGSNTTIIGLGRSATLLGANLILDRVSNVIIRNVAFEDAFDCFPGWDPTDGAEGNWNSLYDNVSLTTATNVWFDHNTMTDGPNQDSGQPLHFGRPLQVHDGLIDITRASDLVTLTYNNFFEHDKAILIGSTNTVGADVGKLRVTLHHNRFANVGQRAPRVRFGQVDVYNNYYVITDEDTYQYSWGVGVQSAIYAQANFVLRSGDLPPDRVVFDWGGTQMTEIGTLTRVGTGPVTAMSLLEAYNATHEPDIGGDAGWTPVLRGAGVIDAGAVPRVVGQSAGAGKLGI
jgi:pectate lyase